MLMVAVENGALPGGKVGGMGDVLRDVPRALAALGHEVAVVTPGYQRFSRLPGAERVATVALPFRGRLEHVGVYRLPPRAAAAVRFWVLEHPLFAACGAIYCDDPPGRPFATDASRFALFCSAVVHALVAQQLPRPDVIHLHDWHTALVALLLHGDRAAAALADTRRVFSIHNLALQGIRPFAGDESALYSWFPGLTVPRGMVADPRYPDCVNLMRAGINLCHKVHAVSPTYAREILRHGEEGGGGAGLEVDLQAADREGRLEGILNGCEYPAPAPAPPFEAWPGIIRPELMCWLGRSDQVRSCDLLGLRRLDDWERAGCARPALVATSVGRMTAQKLSLLARPMADGRPALEHVLDTLGEERLLVVLGSGEPALERLLTRCAGERGNLLFLGGYSETLAELLYTGGDLFLMPSSFEPCGISQMLAMRAGQPCLVHAVGGLVDTVVDGETGFRFGGDGPGAQADAMLGRLRDALALHARPRDWAALCRRAAAARFPWEEVARQYQERLYRGA
nr:glycogen/starch synthase [Parahaliea mediterranea]